jgi:signal transduction histidine kinase
MAATLGKIKKNVDTIETAVAKTQKIVFALKSYSYKTHDEQSTEVDVAENMRTILTIYGNQLKYGVELVTNFDENLPIIQGWPDELSQVWTNIIHNALQAMDNKGRLQIDILKDPKGILVKITDSGPGIPKEIQDKIFQAFFTTKKQGEGSGLGLDICKKIIEKHKGKIWVDSEPGRTTFLVLLPA